MNGIRTMDRQTVEAELLRMRAFEDDSLGIREEFMTPEIAGATSVAVLSRPLRVASSIGWVICHSFGAEQIYFQPLEIPLARRLAAGGFPVLRFHGQGYGDSALTADSISVGSHLQGVQDAVRLLLESTDVAQVGLIGARFGGTMAALSAERSNASALVLWDPIVSGRVYVRYLTQLGVMTDLLTHGRSRETAANPMEVLGRTGVLDVQGFPLHRQVVDEVSAIDLNGDLPRLRGDMLIVQVSRAPKPSPALARLRDRMQQSGAHADLEIVTDPAANKFGQPRYVPRAAGRKIDTQHSLADSLISLTLTWCQKLDGSRSFSEGGAGC